MIRPLACVMRRLRTVTTVLLCLGILWAGGCGSDDEALAERARIESELAHIRVQLNEGVAHHHVEILRRLQMLSANPHVTEAQEQQIDDLVNACVELAVFDLGRDTGEPPRLD